MGMGCGSVFLRIIRAINQRTRVKVADTAQGRKYGEFIVTKENRKFNGRV